MAINNNYYDVLIYIVLLIAGFFDHLINEPYHIDQKKRQLR